MVPKWLDVIMQRYSIASVDDLYASVGYGGFTVNQILSKLIDFYKKEERAKAPAKVSQSRRQLSTNGVIVKGHDDLLVRISKCCNPVPGDDIVGFISRGRGVAIHRKDCPNLKNVEDFRLIEAAMVQRRRNAVLGCDADRGERQQFASRERYHDDFRNETRYIQSQREGGQERNGDNQSFGCRR